MNILKRRFGWRRVVLASVLMVLPLAAYAANAVCSGDCPFCCLHCILC